MEKKISKENIETNAERKENRKKIKSSKNFKELAVPHVFVYSHIASLSLSLCLRTSLFVSFLASFFSSFPFSSSTCTLTCDKNFSSYVFHL